MRFERVAPARLVVGRRAADRVDGQHVVALGQQRGRLAEPGLAAAAEEHVGVHVHHEVVARLVGPKK